MLKDYIDAYIAAGFDRWHTPGHKGTLNEGDITELVGEKYFPTDCVKRAEENCARLLGCRHVRFLSGGSSQGVKAAILAVGGKIVTGTNNHPSVAEGCRLAHCGAVYVQNNEADGLPMPLSAEQIDRALTKNPDAAAVLVLSPDYYGRCAQAESVERVVHAHKKLLICDAAHGAHFAASKALFPNSFISRADAVNLSAHKTLNAYTQSAYLCVNNDALLQKTDAALKLLGTTSPSYLLFSQLEQAALLLSGSGQAYKELKQRTDAFRAQIPCLGGKTCPTSLDFTRLTVDCLALGLPAKALCESLVTRKIMPEKADGRYLVFIATPFDSAEKFNRLVQAVQACTVRP